MARILLVDDDHTLLHTCSAFMRLHGHRVAVAVNGEDALALAATFAPDVVFVDLKLPDMSGLDVIRRLQDVAPPASSVLVTGFGTFEVAVDAIRAGANELASKPLFADEYLRIARRLSQTPENRDSREFTSGVRREALHRWAHVVMSLLDSPTDVVTLEEWGRRVFASVGALRNWCYSAALPPRRSLLFARLLRAVHRQEHGANRPHDLLRSVDRRTIAKLLVMSGGTHEALPRSVHEFLQRQQILHDRKAVDEIKAEFVKRGLDVEDG